jgi:hypothetical protein
MLMTQDEFDCMQIDQLSKQVLQLSKNCFEIKKLCLTVLISALVLVTTLASTPNDKRLDLSHFYAMAVIIAFFYNLDAYGYYLQEKLRLRMGEIAKRMVETPGNPGIIVVGMPVKGLTQNGSSRVPHAFLNSSMLFYWALLVIDLVIFLLFTNGIIE